MSSLRDILQEVLRERELVVNPFDPMEAPVLKVKSRKVRSWWDKYPYRLDAERMMMAEKFSQFQLAESVRRKGRLAWKGWLKTDYGTTYWIEIVYPEDYPNTEPKTYVIRPSLVKGAPHVYMDGSLHVHIQPWRSDTSTAVALVPVAADWLLRYDQWRLPER